MLFQLAALFARSFLQGKLTSAGWDNEVAKNLSYLVVPAIEFILMWPILWQNKTAIVELFPAPNSWARMINTAIALGLAVRLCAWSVLISATAFGWFDYAPPGQARGPTIWFACPPAPALILAVVVTAILIPVGEEVINRGLIVGAMIRKNRNRAMAVSAILFAVLHEPLGAPAAFCSGILLAIQTVRSQSLLPSIITHATYNLLRVMDWFCLHGIWNPGSINSGIRLVGVAAIFTGLLSLGTALWLAAYAETGTKVPPRS